MREHFVFLSGCGWSDCGGAQRPPALARCLLEEGHEVSFYGGPRLGSLMPMDKHRPRLLASEAELMALTGEEPGWVIICLPTYWRLAEAFRLCGWRVCYDLLDDWSGFVAHGDLPQNVLTDEATLFAQADRVICSAPALLQRAAAWGRDDTMLVPNGGPEAPLSNIGGGPTAVYSGYLFGSWFDWQLLGELEDAGVETEVIGGYQNVPEWEHIKFLGELPWPEALVRMTTAQVGIIPFQHDAICESADPIKAYDYWACGLWTVATPTLTALRGRPYTLFGERGTFVRTVRDAVEAQQAQRPSGDFVLENSWSRRVGLLVEALRKPATMRLRPVAALPEPTTPEASCRLRLTWQAPVRCNREQPCSYCNNATERAAKPQDMPGTAEAWFRVFARLADAGHGPLYLSVCYGEPLSDSMVMEVVARLARFTKIDLVSNLLAAPAALRGIPRNGNVAICASWHPEAWPDLATFLERRAQVEGTGIQVPTVQVVAWPPFLDKIDDWGKQCADAGAAFGVLPFWGTYEGKAYPDAYESGTERWQADPRTGGSGDRWFGKACRTGKDYIFVGYDGEVYRCVMPSPRMGNLLRGDVELATEATACPAERCPCPDLWKYREVGL